MRQDESHRHEADESPPSHELLGRNMRTLEVRGSRDHLWYVPSMVLFVRIQECVHEGGMCLQFTRGAICPRSPSVVDGCASPSGPQTPRNPSCVFLRSNAPTKLSNGMSIPDQFEFYPDTVVQFVDWSMCHLKVVLLCKGRGGDAASYKPTRDESQWWNRRDALVRCVSSFLHGPWSTHCSSRELVLLHDEDWARIHMQVADPAVPTQLLPTEQNIVAAWKAAATSPATSGYAAKDKPASPWTCRVERVASSSSSTASSSAVQHMDSKRQVLEHLQAHCSLEFLRSHGLNSKPDVVLRKTNKKALVEKWFQWVKANPSPDASSLSSPSPLEAILSDLLAVPAASPQTKILAGVLHESHDAELPVFGSSSSTSIAAADPNLHVVLFLGAVRDMHPSENKTLRAVCAAQHIPLTHVRLGPVAEFTSKILSIVAFHHARGVLGPALLQRTTTDASSSSKRKRIATSTSSPTRAVHVFGSVPLPLAALSADLDARQSALWRVVRVVVATLYRSHVMRAGSSLAPPSLTLLFDDGGVLELTQETLVGSLAEAHQAAPTEFQILRALVKTRDASAVKNWKDDEGAAWLVAAAAPFAALDVTHETGDGALVDAIHAMPEEDDDIAEHSRTLAVLVSIESTTASHDALKAACAAQKIPVVPSCILSAATTVDVEAATITMLQHFVYQRRLFGYVASVVNASKKTRKDAKRAKKAAKKAKHTHDDE
ncbi:Aste57867_14397 [Aphanomyces stellatus]|uniref:Aste57867_14397 protein n=1 Tax=Aphanomyces stellatus TaxID=120398 RepID=A0A485L139_9STRA|nr:hypothetical protein As57867_014343 [Aphanomyces stellatus]VFT91219.1 Aste57867_14397 [Aphanomyces stellatus]